MSMWIKAAPWLIIAVLIAALSIVSNRYLAKRDELVTLQVTVKTIGEQAAANVKRIEQQGKDNKEKSDEYYLKTIAALNVDIKRFGILGCHF